MADQEMHDSDCDSIPSPVYEPISVATKRPCPDLPAFRKKRSSQENVNQNNTENRFQLIVTFPDSTKPFKKWAIEDRKRVLLEIESTLKHSRVHVGAAGDLFINPANEIQKMEILLLSVIDKKRVHCHLSKQESEPKRVIRGIPITEDSITLVSELMKEGVTNAKRIHINKDNVDILTGTVILTFDRKPPNYLTLAGVKHALSELK